MFVALHELTHLATTDIGHTPQYWQNFKFILENIYELHNPLIRSYFYVYYLESIVFSQ